MRGVDYGGVVSGIAQVLRNLGESTQREGLKDTPSRYAHMMINELTSGYDADPTELFRTFEPDGYDQLIAMTMIPFYSLCEHHLMPFFGYAHVGYVPGSRIIGLSKIARLVEVFSRRLQVQERLTKQIADALDEGLMPQGCIVVTEARHLCMEMRGVQAVGVLTTMSELHGVFRQNPKPREEFLALLPNRPGMR